MNIVEQYNKQQQRRYNIEEILKQMNGFKYAVQREPAPIYTLGNPSPSRGRRGIAGTMSFKILDDKQIEILKAHFNGAGNNLTVYINQGDLYNNGMHMENHSGPRTFYDLEILNDDTELRFSKRQQFTFIAKHMDSSTKTDCSKDNPVVYTKTKPSSSEIKLTVVNKATGESFEIGEVQSFSMEGRR